MSKGFKITLIIIFLLFALPFALLFLVNEVLNPMFDKIFYHDDMLIPCHSNSGEYILHINMKKGSDFNPVKAKAEELGFEFFRKDKKDNFDDYLIYTKKKMQLSKTVKDEIVDSADNPSDILDIYDLKIDCYIR